MPNFMVYKNNTHKLIPTTDHWLTIQETVSLSSYGKHVKPWAAPNFENQTKPNQKNQKIKTQKNYFQ